MFYTYIFTILALNKIKINYSLAQRPLQITTQNTTAYDIGDYVNIRGVKNVVVLGTPGNMELLLRNGKKTLYDSKQKISLISRYKPAGLPYL